MPDNAGFVPDDVDTELIQALKDDGRRSNVDLARDLGVSEKTVRNRIKRLVERGGLRITARVESPGAAVQVIFLIHAAPGRRFALGERLLEYPEVTQVLLSNGAADLIVYASFPDDDRALRFLVRSIEASPDVRDSSACSIISRVGTDGPASPDARVPHVRTADLFDAMLHPPEFGEIQQVVEWICETMTHCFSADHALCVIYNSESDPAASFARRVLASSTLGLSQGYADLIYERLRSAEVSGVVQHALTTRQHVFVDNALTSPLMAGTADVIRREGYISMIAFPILFGAMPFGVCSLYFDQQIMIDEMIVGAAQNFLDQCAVTIARVEPKVVRMFGAELNGRLPGHPPPPA